jgi:hypothetical protein
MNGTWLKALTTLAPGASEATTSLDVRSPKSSSSLGMQLSGHKNAEIAKRIDIAATVILHGMTVDAVSDLDLSYSCLFGGRR